MAKLLAQFLYTWFIFPLIFVGAHLYALFSSRIRAGLLPRYESLHKLTAWRSQQDSVDKIILIHAASLGEFEHIKPLLHRFKEEYSTVNIVTFFSPSGYRHVKKYNFLDLFLYMPFDTRRNWKKVYELLKPVLIIVAKHDVWPKQIWTAREFKIPVYLTNASMAENSTRSKAVVRDFLGTVYRDFDRIYAISEEDGKRFKSVYPGCKVEIMGDTKYDQVVIRKQTALNHKLLPAEWVQNKFTIAAGSTWTEDEQHLLPALRNILLKYEFVNLILIPHQPEEKTLRIQLDFFKDWDTILFSNRKHIRNQRIIITDVVGYLAGLYLYANVAYVGGSFRQGVHNVMEPAIFGIPVLYGPEHKNSYEAIKLAEHKGGIIVNNTVEIQEWLEKFIQDPSLCKNIGYRAEQYVLGNTGATDRLLAGWENTLGAKKSKPV
jgi:3-deoxy-D-manno-octulosonic-acid transferase